MRKTSSHIDPLFPIRVDGWPIPGSAWVACGYCLFLLFVLG